MTISVLAGTMRSMCLHRRSGIGLPARRAATSSSSSSYGIGAAAVRNAVAGGPISIAASRYLPIFSAFSWYSVRW
jgi:hypothetical protein